MTLNSLIILSGMSLDLENVLESNRLTLTKNLLNILASALPSVTSLCDSFPKLFIVVSIT